MKIKFRLAPALTLFLTSIAFATAALAANYTASGTIDKLNVRNGAISSLQDFVTLNGVTSLGTCGTSDGFVIFKLPNRSTSSNEHKAMISILQGAKLAGRAVTINATDTPKTDTSYCTIYAITME
jgi:hypothetical protein